MTSYPELFVALAAPFASHEVKSRPQGGRQLMYITARTAMNRFDEVVGPENWWDEYKPTEHGVVCKLTLRLPDGQMIAKCDCGGHAGMQDEGDDEKSGFSDAFKRSAVKWGVGRYLYGDGSAEFLHVVKADGEIVRRQRERESAPAPAPVIVPDPEAQQAEAWSYGKPPQNGSRLWGWIQDGERAGHKGLYAFVCSYGAKMAFAPQIKTWPEAPAVEAWQAAVDWLKRGESA